MHEKYGNGTISSLFMVKKTQSGFFVIQTGGDHYWNCFQSNGLQSILWSIKRGQLHFHRMSPKGILHKQVE